MLQLALTLIYMTNQVFMLGHLPNMAHNWKSRFRAYDSLDVYQLLSSSGPWSHRLNGQTSQRENSILKDYLKKGPEVTL